MPTATLDDIDIPARLLDAVARHQKHVADLASRFRFAGMDDAMIKTSINHLVESYRTELLQAIDAMRDDDHA